MKKGLLLVFVAGFAVITYYLLIPSQYIINSRQKVAATLPGLQRGLYNQSNWKAWWPQPTQQGLAYNGNRYAIKDVTTFSVFVDVTNNKATHTSAINFVPVATDTVLVSWEDTLQLSANPFIRWQQHRQAKALRADVANLLQRLAAYYSKSENIYGIKIKADYVKDTALIATGKIFNKVPDVTAVYQMVAMLKTYALQQGAVITNYPMLNISTEDSVHFLTKVALPLNKKIEDKGDIQSKWMLPDGNILVAEVQGGPNSINAALKKIEMYAEEYRRIAPAIPFQSLVTDRTTQPDTSKWITRLYFPVM